MTSTETRRPGRPLNALNKVHIASDDRRASLRPRKVFFCTISGGKSTTDKEAVNSIDSTKCSKAINDELNLVEKNDILVDLVVPFTNCITTRVRLFLEMKQSPCIKVRYKERLVAQVQQPGYDIGSGPVCKLKKGFADVTLFICLYVDDGLICNCRTEIEVLELFNTMITASDDQSAVDDAEVKRRFRSGRTEQAWSFYNDGSFFWTLVDELSV